MVSFHLIFSHKSFSFTTEIVNKIKYIIEYIKHNYQHMEKENAANLIFITLYHKL